MLRRSFRGNFVGFTQTPRRYIPDDEGGLLICTWPHNDRPDLVQLYAVAGAMLYEGQLEPARRIVRMARGRYDGRLRKDLNSGPGGNPYNELECGKFYARAMSSWSLLVACQGLLLEGPRGLLGSRPGPHGDGRDPSRTAVAFRRKDPEQDLKTPKFQGPNFRVRQIQLLGGLVE